MWLELQPPNNGRMMLRIILPTYIMEVSFLQNQMAYISSFLHPIPRKISEIINSKKDEHEMNYINPPFKNSPSGYNKGAKVDRANQITPNHQPR